ncbi:hypothetical protein BS47DRAFT_1290284, partial [Hydnum rufescens UP504]
LALQGAFVEHQAILSHGQTRLPTAVRTLLVRTQDELAECDALIIPGGESTTMALLARLTGLLAPLREFACSKPVWGICAGAILLASGGIVGAKKNGQEVIGGIDVRVERNGWGSQLESFEAELTVAGLWDPNQPFVGVFIRAPVRYPSPIKVLARLPSSLLPAITSQETFERQDPQLEAHSSDSRTIVALRQGRHLLTTFHPELTKDDRFHEYFINECVLGPPADQIRDSHAPVAKAIPIYCV